MPAKEVMKNGLCSTCNNSSGCMYLATRTAPAHYCEQFSTFVPPVKKRRTSHSLFAASNPGQRLVKTNGHLGLCVTCDDADKCSFTSQEGGVWHCEEYH